MLLITLLPQKTKWIGVNFSKDTIKSLQVARLLLVFCLKVFWIIWITEIKTSKLQANIIRYNHSSLQQNCENMKLGIIVLISKTAPKNCSPYPELFDILEQKIQCLAHASAVPERRKLFIQSTNQLTNLIINNYIIECTIMRAKGWGVCWGWYACYHTGVTILLATLSKANPKHLELFTFISLYKHIKIAVFS